MRTISNLAAVQRDIGQPTSLSTVSMPFRTEYSQSRSRCSSWSSPSLLNLFHYFEPYWRQWPDFLGYFISFAFIGASWISHSGLTKLMKRGDTVAFGVNLLLFVALLPFTTRIMVTHMSGPGVGVAVLIYGINVLLGSLLLSLLMFYVARQPALLVDVPADLTLKQLYCQRWFAIGVAIIAVAIAIVAPYLAIALYLLETILLLILPLVGLRKSRGLPTNGEDG